MAQFALMLNGDPKNWGATAEEQKQIMQNFGLWVRGLMNEKQYMDCTRLEPKMARVSATQTDGPFTETKELFSGIFRIEVASFEQAVNIAKTCPMLARGEQILVMPIDDGERKAP